MEEEYHVTAKGKLVIDILDANPELSFEEAIEMAERMIHALS